MAATAMQLYNLQLKKVQLTNDLSKISRKVSDIESENGMLESELIYMKNENRLIREAKAQFNYAEADEKLIIVVPKKL